jgi:hypothetical protein
VEDSEFALRRRPGERKDHHVKDSGSGSRPEVKHAAVLNQVFSFSMYLIDKEVMR